MLMLDDQGATIAAMTRPRQDFVEKSAVQIGVTVLPPTHTITKVRKALRVNWRLMLLTVVCTLASALIPTYLLPELWLAVLVAVVLSVLTMTIGFFMVVRHTVVKIETWH